MDHSTQAGELVERVRVRTTFKFRVKDKHRARLNSQAQAVNLVWNYCNNCQKDAIKWNKPWPSGYELQSLTAGATLEGLDLQANTVARVCSEYFYKRRQARKPWLRWRGKKSLGWVPFKGIDLRFSDGAFYFRRRRYDVWLTREIPRGSQFGSASFNQDARGNWYINVSVHVEASSPSASAIGVDLGLSSLATLSNGDKIKAPQFYRKSEEVLATSQRRRKTKRTKSIHAKIANRRKDFLHKASTKIARENGLIVVGDISSSQLSKTKMAKSVHDAGWADFKSMLAYKAIRHGAIYLEVSEANTTRTCSGCGCIAGPSGYAGLNKRMWICDCGAVHDRDVNAAINILAAGHRRLAEGIQPQMAERMSIRAASSRSRTAPGKDGEG